MTKNFKYFSEFMEHIEEGGKLSIKYNSPIKTITFVVDSVNNHNPDTIYLSNKKTGKVEVNIRHDYDYQDRELIFTKTDGSEDTIVISDINHAQFIKTTTDEIGGTSRQYLKFIPTESVTGEPEDEERYESNGNGYSEPSEEEEEEEEEEMSHNEETPNNDVENPDDGTYDDTSNYDEANDDEVSLLDDDDVGQAIREFVIKKYNREGFEVNDKGGNRVIYADGFNLNGDDNTLYLFYKQDIKKRLFGKDKTHFKLYAIRLSNYPIDERTTKYFFTKYLREFLILTEDEFSKLITKSDYEDEDEDEDGDQTPKTNQSNHHLSETDIENIDKYEMLSNELEDDSHYIKQQHTQIKNIYDEILNTLRTLKDGDKVFIFQSDYNDIKGDIEDHFEKYAMEYGTEPLAKSYTIKKLPNINFSYNSEKEESKVIFNVKIDEEDPSDIRIVNIDKKQAHKTDGATKINIKNGHRLNPDNLFIDSDINNGITLKGRHGLFVNQIIGLKRYEDIPDEHSDVEVTDKDILKMMQSNKELANYVFKTPGFFDYLKKGGKVNQKVKNNLLAKTVRGAKERQTGTIEITDVIQVNDATYQLDGYGDLTVGLRINGTFRDYGQYVTFYITHASASARVIFRDLSNKDDATGIFRIGGGMFIGKFKFRVL